MITLTVYTLSGLRCSNVTLQLISFPKFILLNSLTKEGNQRKVGKEVFYFFVFMSKN